MLIFQTPTPTAMKPTVILLFAFLSPGVQATEPLPELKPLLGERGAAVLTETFDGPNAKPLDVIPAAKSELAEGAVRLLKRPKAKHPGIAFIYGKEHPPLHDFILEADFRWDDGQQFNFQFAKPGKTEHGVPPEFFIRFGRPKNPARPGFWDITDNAPRTTVGKHAATFTPGQWYRVMIEVRDGEVAVQLSNGQSLRGTCNLASTPKRPPQIGFDDGASGVLVDNIKIFAFR
jgi:hypothetical protein